MWSISSTSERQRGYSFILCFTVSSCIDVVFSLPLHLIRMMNIDKFARQADESPRLLLRCQPPHFWPFHDLSIFGILSRWFLIWFRSPIDIEVFFIKCLRWRSNLSALFLSPRVLYTAVARMNAWHAVCVPNVQSIIATEWRGQWSRCERQSSEPKETKSRKETTTQSTILRLQGI